LRENDFILITYSASSKVFTFHLLIENYLMILISHPRTY